MRREKPDITANNGESVFARLKQYPLFEIIVLLGVIAHAVMLDIQIITGAESEKWLQTQGTIITADVVERTGGDSGRTKNTFYEVVVTYRYTVLGIQYTGERATASGGWFYSSESEARKRVEQLMERPDIAVYFDPDDHSNALLERGSAERDVLGLLVTVPFIGVAAGLLARKVLRKRKKGWLPVILIGAAAAIVSGLIQWIVLSVFIS
jgi:hypothetical protein